MLTLFRHPFDSQLRHEDVSQQSLQICHFSTTTAEGKIGEWQHHKVLFFPNGSAKLIMVHLVTFGFRIAIWPQFSSHSLHYKYFMRWSLRGILIIICLTV